MLSKENAYISPLHIRIVLLFWLKIQANIDSQRRASPEILKGKKWSVFMTTTVTEKVVGEYAINMCL